MRAFFLFSYRFHHVLPPHPNPLRQGRGPYVGERIATRTNAERGGGLLRLQRAPPLRAQNEPQIADDRCVRS